MTAGKALDIKKVIKAVSNHNFRSGDAKNFISLLNKLEPLIGQDINLAKAMGAYKNGEKLSQGISQNPITRIYTMLANRTIKTALRLAPIIGRQPALIHHIEQAILKSKNYNGFINNLAKIATDKNMPNSIRAELTKFLTARDDLTPKTEAKEATNAISVNQNPSIDELNALQRQNENFNIISESKSSGADSQHAMNRPNDDIIKADNLKTNKEITQDRLLKEIDQTKLNNEQKAVFDVFTGKKDSVILQGKDLSDLYTLESGSRNAGAIKIIVKHAGESKTGGLSNDELLNLMEVVRKGKIKDDSFKQFENRIRYAYELNGEANLRLVVDEYNDGKKIFDYYSDRNFIDYEKNVSDRSVRLNRHSDTSQTMATAKAGSVANNEIIPQNKAKDTKEAEYKARELYFTLSKDGGKNGFIMLSEKEGLEYLTKKYGITKEHAIKTKDKLRKNIENLADITPIKEFGTNYAEFYRDGENAVKKLLAEKQGQVAGAFYKDGLGDIDLVWGEVDKSLNGYGLAKISAKHTADFLKFKGATPYEKMANGLNEIIQKGEVVDKNGVKTIWHKPRR